MVKNIDEIIEELVSEGKKQGFLTYEQIVKLNELGFIEPLDFKDLVLIQKELKQNKKEEVKHGIDTK